MTSHPTFAVKERREWDNNNGLSLLLRKIRLEAQLSRQNGKLEIQSTEHNYVFKSGLTKILRFSIFWTRLNDFLFFLSFLIGKKERDNVLGILSVTDRKGWTVRSDYPRRTCKQGDVWLTHEMRNLQAILGILAKVPRDRQFCLCSSVKCSPNTF